MLSLRYIFLRQHLLVFLCFGLPASLEARRTFLRLPELVHFPADLGRFLTLFTPSLLRCLHEAVLVLLRANELNPLTDCLHEFNLMLLMSSVWLL